MRRLSLNKKPSLEDLSKSELLEFIRRFWRQPSTEEIATFIWEKRNDEAMDDLKRITEAWKNLDLKGPGALERFEAAKKQWEQAEKNIGLTRRYIEKWGRKS